VIVNFERRGLELLARVQALYLPLLLILLARYGQEHVISLLIDRWLNSIGYYSDGSTVTNFVIQSAEIKIIEFHPRLLFGRENKHLCAS
jgi:hypothetical protein